MKKSERYLAQTNEEIIQFSIEESTQFVEKDKLQTCWAAVVDLIKEAVGATAVVVALEDRRGVVKVVGEHYHYVWVGTPPKFVSVNRKSIESHMGIKSGMQ